MVIVQRLDIRCGRPAAPQALAAKGQPSRVAQRQAAFSVRLSRSTTRLFRTERLLFPCGFFRPDDDAADGDPILFTLQVGFDLMMMLPTVILFTLQHPGSGSAAAGPGMGPVNHA